MAYAYPDYISDIGSVLETPVTDSASATPFGNVDYNNWLPRAIEYGEQRIYRELDLMTTHIVDASGTLTAASRLFTLPNAFGTFIVVDEVCVFSPSGTRNQLLPTTKQFIDAAWPTDIPAFTPSVPNVWCPYNQSQIFVGPSPDSNYSMEVTGTIRPEPLSATNQVTILTQYVPDLFMAASLVSWTGFMRDYGQSSDDKQLAQSWENQYQLLKASAAVEQFRVRFSGPAWGSRQPTPATPPQT